MEDTTEWFLGHLFSGVSLAHFSLLIPAGWSLLVLDNYRLTPVFARERNKTTNREVHTGSAIVSMGDTAGGKKGIWTACPSVLPLCHISQSEITNAVRGATDHG